MTGITLPQIGEIREIDGVEMIFEACGRCGGSGSFGPECVDAAICWGCKVYSKRTNSHFGAGGSWVTKADHDRRAHNRELAAARRERKAAELKNNLEGVYAKLVETHPLLAELTYLADYSGVLGDMRARFERTGKLSAAQIAYAEKLIKNGMAAEARKPVVEPQAEAAPAPEGRVTVTGKVVKTEEKFNNYGSYFVMTVLLDDGARVFGTIPRAIDPERGDRVEFVGTFKRSDRDETFAFFSYPAKARVL
jgi:hypothetical protein